MVLAVSQCSLAKQRGGKSIRLSLKSLVMESSWPSYTCLKEVLDYRVRRPGLL